MLTHVFILQHLTFVISWTTRFRLFLKIDMAFNSQNLFNVLFNHFLLLYVVSLLQFTNWCLMFYQVNILQHANFALPETAGKTELLLTRLSITNSVVDPWIYILLRREIYSSLLACVRRVYHTRRASHTTRDQSSGDKLENITLETK